MAENDQETTPSSASGDASTRESYRNLLARLHEEGTLGDDGYRHRLADVDGAKTVGDLEAAINGLNRGDLPVPTRRRQRRELDDAIAEPEDAKDEIPAEEIELDDDELDDDFDDLELPELPGAAKTDDQDTDEDDESTEADDLDEDDDLDDDDDLDEDDLDEDDRPAAKASAKKSTAKKSTARAAAQDSAKGRKRTTAGAGREKKGRATPKRPSSAAKEPESTGAIQFIKESIGELRKVVYPTGSQLGTYFVVVLVFVLFVIGFTSGIDLGLGKLILLVFG